MSEAFILGICAGVIVAGSAILVVRQRRASVAPARRKMGKRERTIVLHLYRHLDEILGAKSFERQRGATLRHRVDMWVGWIPRLGPLFVFLARRAWPPPRPDGTVPWPPHRRRLKYVVAIEYGTWSGGKLLPLAEGIEPSLFHVHSVTLGWSSEAIANAEKFLEHLERGKATLGSGGGSAGLAQALGLEWFEGLFTRERDDAHGRVKLTRTRTTKLPASAGWGEVGDGAR